MKNFNIYLAVMFFSGLIFYGCEQTVDNIELPYVKQLVITGVLEAGKPVRNIRVTRTYPSLTNLDNINGYYDDAEVIIEEGANKYILQWDPDSNDIWNAVTNDYYYTDEFLPEIGKKYKLTVNWRGMTAWAETYIPSLVTIDSVRRNVSKSSWDNYYYDITYYAYIKPVKDAVFMGAICDNINRDLLYLYQRIYGAIYQATDTLKSGVLKIHIYDAFSSDTNNVMDYNYTWPCAAVEAYDKSFYDFYISRGNGSEFDGIFSMSGQNVVWNVKGDGIGIFIGRSVGFMEFKL